jgi:hypothetical protein
MNGVQRASQLRMRDKVGVWAHPGWRQAPYYPHPRGQFPRLSSSHKE